eukprot:XP_011671144.1 PREDICTED: zinc finger protein 354A-like [Strongylocentrotus purpuratus]
MEAPGNPSGMDPCVKERESRVTVKLEPPEFEPTSLTFYGQISDVISYGSNSSGNGVCSTNLSQSSAFSSECSSQSTAMLGRDCEYSGPCSNEIDGCAHSSKIDGGYTSTGNHERKQEENTENFSTELPGVPQGTLLGTTSTLVRLDNNEAEPREFDPTSVRFNSLESSEEPSVESQSLRNGICSLTLLQSNTFSFEYSSQSTAILGKVCKHSGAHSSKIDLGESITGANHDERKEEEMHVDLTIAPQDVPQGVHEGPLLGTEKTSIYSDEIKAEPPAFNLTEQPQEECQSFGPNTSRNSKCSSSTLQSNMFSAESSPSRTAMLVKDCRNSSAECMTGTNHDESIRKGTSDNISIESPGVPQGTLLGTPTTSFCSNEVRTNHSMTSLEKTLELVKKRKNGMSKVEGESCKKAKRKRKPTKPIKSMEYCNEAERMVVGNLPSPKATASYSTDQVMLMEADSSALNDEQFSQFSTQHMHCLLNFKRYECLQCGLGFASKKAMNVHIRTHSEEKPYWCTECDIGFTEHHLYMSHMQSHRPYECDECGADFADSTTLQNHKLLHLQSKNFKCSVCSKMFKQRAGLASHMMNAHPQSHTDDKPFWCKECNKGFTQNHSYKAHLRIHSGERPYLCKECGAAFADNKTLQNHKALHSDEKTFKCTVCPKMFRQRAGLACHMKTHTDEKPFMCELCGQSFKTKSTLKNHQRIHSEEKPYQCPLCPQAFKQRAGLACHSKVHDKGIPY